MKTENRIKRYALIAILTALFLLDVFIASMTYRYYSVVARGFSGIALIYLLFFFIRYSRLDVSIDTLLLDPKKGKYLVAALIVPLFSYWAIMQIYETVLFFGKR